MTGEFAAIAAIRALLPGPPDASQEWIGDDAAILPMPGPPWLLFATDAVVQGVHADLSITGLDDFGWKALAAAVSDVAAMGGDSGCAVVTVGCPEGMDLPLLYEGLGAAARSFDCPIVGGDLVECPVLVVSVAVTGTCEGTPVRRSGAQQGDGVFVTRPLGAAAAGLRLYRSGAFPSDPPPPPSDPLPLPSDPPRPAPDLAALLRAHARPIPELRAGRAARLGGATAMIDVSDGLSADVDHLATASGVGVRIETVPVADGATMEEALGGGEDFALVFTAADDDLVSNAFAALTPPIRIGTCTQDPSERRLQGRDLPAAGWEHRV